MKGQEKGELEEMGTLCLLCLWCESQISRSKCDCPQGECGTSLAHTQSHPHTLNHSHSLSLIQMQIPILITTHSANAAEIIKNIFSLISWQNDKNRMKIKYSSKRKIENGKWEMQNAFGCNLCGHKINLRNNIYMSVKEGFHLLLLLFFLIYLLCNPYTSAPTLLCHLDTQNILKN